MVFHIRLEAVLDMHKFLRGRGDIREQAHAVACHDGRAQRGGLLDVRHVDRDAQHVGENLAPEFALGRAAGKYDFLGNVARGLADELPYGRK